MSKPARCWSISGCSRVAFVERITRTTQKITPAWMTALLFAYLQGLLYVLIHPSGTARIAPGIIRLMKGPGFAFVLNWKLFIGVVYSIFHVFHMSLYNYSRLFAYVESMRDVSTQGKSSCLFFNISYYIIRVVKNALIYVDILNHQWLPTKHYCAVHNGVL